MYHVPLALQYIYGGGNLGLIFRGQEARACVIFVSCERIWNVPAVSLVFPTFDDTGSPGCPRCRVVYHPSVSTLVTPSRILVVNRKAELKPTTFFSLLLFSVFLSFLFSYQAPPYPSAI